MFFSDKARLIVDDLYHCLRTYFTDFLVKSNFNGTESYNITVHDSTVAWLANKYTYKIEFYRTTMGEIDHIKIYAQSRFEINQIYRDMCENHSFLGLKVSEVIRFYDYILAKPQSLQ